MATPYTLYRRLPTMRQRSRRIAIVAAVTGFPLLLIGYSTLVETGRLSTVIWAPIAIALFSTTLLGVLAVYGYGQGRMDHRERLDERQRIMIDRALVVGYSVLTTVIVAISGCLAFYLSIVGSLQLDMGVLTPWFVAIGLYVPFLPSAALAWIEPDPPAGDEEA
jgi:hypothetical protein